MPLPMAPSSPRIDKTTATYPAITKKAAAVIDDIATDVTSTQFADKIMVTISQGGRLAQWVMALHGPSTDKTLIHLFRCKCH